MNVENGGAGLGPPPPRHRLTRRALLRDLGIGAVALGVGGAAGYEWPRSRPAPSTSPGPLPENDELVFRSRTDLIPPRTHVTVSGASAAPGYILLTPSLIPGARALTKNSGLKLGVGQQGPMILDNKNHVVWFSPIDEVATNLQVQEYRGEPVLTYWRGSIVQGIGYGEGVILDSNYRQVATIHGGDGLQPDLHDFTLTPEGTALVTAYAKGRADLSPLGGSKRGEVFDSVAMEIDVPSGKVLHQWHSLEHVPVEESQSRPGPGTFDYFHINSLSLDDPDHLLISARNTWALYRVERSSGRVVWRLGGKRSDFTLNPGAQFYWQHNSRRQPDGTLTLFDDGASPAHESQSRALVLALHDATKTVSVVKEYTHSGPLLAHFEGSTQILPNGNVFVGWGSLPYFSEFLPDGTQVVDGRLPTNVQSYRAFRSSWTARPTEAPALTASKNSFNDIVVHMSWNGSTELAGWAVLIGNNARQLRRVATIAKSGFETVATIERHGTHLAVAALDADGHHLAQSKTLTV